MEILRSTSYPKILTLRSTSHPKIRFANWEVRRSGFLSEILTFIIPPILKIWKNIFKKLPDYRCCNLTAIICSLRVMNNYKCKNFRIIRRRKSYKRCNISSTSTGKGLTCCRFTTNGKSFYIALFSLPFSTTCSNIICIVSDVSSEIICVFTG